MSASKKNIFFLILFSGSLACSAQDHVNDAAIWTNIYLEKKMNEQFDIHLNQKNSITENFSLYNMGYADVGVTYNFNKSIKILADYVFTEKRIKDGTYSTRHQFYVALVLKKKINKWQFMYRNMLAWQLRDVLSSYDGGVPVFHDRSKFTIKYDINKRFTAYIAEELYIPLYQPRYRGMDRSRSYVGMFYKLTKHIDLELYFMYQHQLNSFKRTKRDYIYGIGFSRQF